MSSTDSSKHRLADGFTKLPQVLKKIVKEYMFCRECYQINPRMCKKCGDFICMGGGIQYYYFWAERYRSCRDGTNRCCICAAREDKEVNEARAIAEYNSNLSKRVQQ